MGSLTCTRVIQVVDAETVGMDRIGDCSRRSPMQAVAQCSRERAEVRHSLADDLGIPLNRVGGHLGDDVVAGLKGIGVTLAAADGGQDVGDPLVGAASHSATASARAESEIFVLSSCTG